MQNWKTCNLDVCLLKEHCHGILWPSAACSPISSLWHMTHAKANACYSRGLSCDVMLLCFLLNCACSCRMAHVRRQKQANKNGHGRNGSLVQTEVHLWKNYYSGKCNPSKKKKTSPPLGHRACFINQLKLYQLKLYSSDSYSIMVPITTNQHTSSHLFCSCSTCRLESRQRGEGTGRTIYNNLYTETILHIIKSQHK